MKVFSVAGYHHTGKTAVVTSLLKELGKRGYSVSSIKDIHNEEFSLEKPNSNSWQHWQASGGVVFARGKKETYQIWHQHLSLNQMLRHLQTDYVVIEGMKTAAVPHIICAENSIELDELVDETTFAISGKYANGHQKYKDLPVINAKHEIEHLADLVENKVFAVLPLADPKCCQACGMSCYQMTGAILRGEKRRSDCVLDNSSKQIVLKIDGREEKVVPFVQNLLKDAITSLVRNLKGCQHGKIEIEIQDED
ncbi:MAG TPA: molybdopterin-guanine dinucleotide biosynthesis protein B [Candidatus Cloacimonas sp.]|jgi:molybdopterin-guanine dinucleotide biosynthesis protein B|nr:molybdopterin-guanine dinucleotide biosynthesis adapter protein [Candidatus Cloacimonadota bacterium]HCX73436.1 molybdopterin-guanine dinucleotide biosynthesis protein B [Candidatus Cloacimonas sp.]